MKMDDALFSLRKNMHNAIDEKDLPMYKLAEYCNVDYSSFRNLLIGRMTEPRLSMLVNISNALQKPISTLIGESDRDWHREITLAECMEKLRKHTYEEMYNRKISIEAFSGLCGVSQRKMWELQQIRNAKRNIALSTIIKYSNEIGMPIWYLIGE